LIDNEQAARQQRSADNQAFDDHHLGDDLSKAPMARITPIRVRSMTFRPCDQRCCKRLPWSRHDHQEGGEIFSPWWWNLQVFTGAHRRLSPGG
jgi:hypothetical protein